MDSNLLAVVALIGVALVFDFINGFHDAANSIATVVSTRVLTPGKAVVWAAFFNFIAVFPFGTAVAKTVGAGLVTSNVRWVLLGVGAVYLLVSLRSDYRPPVRRERKRPWTRSAGAQPAAGPRTASPDTSSTATAADPSPTATAAPGATSSTGRSSDIGRMAGRATGMAVNAARRRRRSS